MDRTTFEALRDLPGKVIGIDVKLSRHQALAPVLAAVAIPIQNASGVDLVMSIRYNPMVGSKTVNVHVPGVGPICRLDVDGPKHPPAGRSHKHSIQVDRCPGRNLPDGVIDRPDLTGSSVREVFDEFCRMADITHSGQFEDP